MVTKTGLARKFGKNKPLAYQRASIPTSELFLGRQKQNRYKTDTKKAEWNSNRLYCLIA
jgi:hypothetical protein